MTAFSKNHSAWVEIYSTTPTGKMNQHLYVRDNRMIQRKQSHSGNCTDSHNILSKSHTTIRNYSVYDKKKNK